MGLDVTGRYRYPLPAPVWLAKAAEEAIDPAMPIIDAHHHFWEEGGAPYLLEQLQDDIEGGHDIRATLCVEAHYSYRQHGPEALRPLGETEAVMQLHGKARAAGLRTRVAEGLVARADLLLGDAVDAVLDGHQDIAGPALRGIRHSVSRDENFPNGVVIRPAPKGLLADPAYRRGMARLAARGLVYDAMLYHAQLPELVAAARAMPQLSIVLDHIGCVLGVGIYVGRRNDLFARWWGDMAALADCPNVSVKIGGFGMIVCGADWHLRDAPPSSAELAACWQDWIDACIDLFGAERCMFESNFPVDKAMYPYRTLWNAFKLATHWCSPDERAALFGGTAQRVYGLDPALLSIGTRHG